MFDSLDRYLVGCLQKPRLLVNIGMRARSMASFRMQLVAAIDNMSQPIEIRVPNFPECWDSCGACKSSEVSVQSVQVSPGDIVAEYDVLIILETAKTALEIPSPVGGNIVEIFVSEYQPINPGDLIALIDSR